jgi:hypothetical protein
MAGSVRIAVVIVALALAAACKSSGGSGGAPPAPAAETPSREVVNLRAFARLYGVVRWFHPSDEAAEADWNELAIRGVVAVRGAPDRKALQTALDAVVGPVSAGIVIGTSDELAAAPPAAMPPTDALVELVAWQHAGPGFDGGAGPYQSKRTARAATLRRGGDWGAFSQAIDAAALRGKRVRLRAELAAGKRSRVGVWLRVDLAGGATGFFDNMQARPVMPPAWEQRTIEGEVAADAERVVLGGIVWGDEGWFDDFVLEVADGAGVWTAVALDEPGFESGVQAWTSGTQKGGRRGDDFVLASAIPPYGRSAAAELRVPVMPLVVDPFEARPAEGETVTVELGDGLFARVPIALASVDGHTVPVAAGELPSAAAIGADAAAIADVIVAWNVFAHFYPYLDVIATDWHAHLDDALASVTTAGGDAGAGREVLRRLVVAAEDGHGRITTDEPRKFLPLVLEEAEGKLIVELSGDPAVRRGDEVVAVDGVPIARALETEVARYSGSRQWRTTVALRTVGWGPDGSIAAVELRRGDALISVRVPRALAPPRYTYPPIGEIEPGIWLVDLSRADARELEAKMGTLAAARGVVFDLRGYPNDTHGVLAHLLDAPEQDRWMHTAQIIRPNLPGQPLPAHTWDSVGWNLAPAAPRLRGKVVFMTGPGAISYAESVMGYVEALGLPIVGAATAGTNGNVRQVALPSGAAFAFTGMKVTRHDGTRSHLEGIRPTVPVERTTAGVMAGKDELLERALALVR